MAEEIRKEAASARRIVVKVGSGVLTRNGALRPRVLGDIARQTAELLAQGREVVIVSSGAIAMGSRMLGWSHPGRSIPEKQAAAAVGQIGLSELWRRRFARLERNVAQVLVTRAGLDDRERFLNARHTLSTLLSLGVVPVVNENDTVATEEIRFGDNDNLSASVVNLVAADLLVILTDVEGLYRVAPAAGRPGQGLFGVVTRITPEIEQLAGASASAFGRGGMITKLQAARTAARSGAATVLCNGRRARVLLEVAAGAPVGTLIVPGDRMQSRKHWLAFTARPRGRLVLDDGAVAALRERRRSLLPVGVAQVEGSFGIGDPVSCVDSQGREIARGLSAYASSELLRIRGISTREIVRVLGYSNGEEVIHRDDLVVVEDGETAKATAEEAAEGGPRSGVAEDGAETAAPEALREKA